MYSLLYGVAQRAREQGLYFKPRMSRSKRKSSGDIDGTTVLFKNSLVAQTVKSLSTLVAQMVKSLPPMRETRVQDLGWEDPLEKEMAAHSSTIAWKIPWTEEPGRQQSVGSQRVGHD